MGYSLILYRCPWTKLRDAVTAAAGHAAPNATIQQARRDFEDALNDNDEQLPAGVTVQSAFETAAGVLDRCWSAHDVGRPPEEVDLLPTLAMFALIRQTGRYIASLEHNSNAGTLFRDQFIRNELVAKLAFPKAADLIGHGAFGSMRTEYPFWGGLELGDVIQLIPLLSTTQNSNVDVDGWLSELKNALKEAEWRQEDVVTLYL